MKVVRGRSGLPARVSDASDAAGVLRMDPVFDEGALRAFEVVLEPGARNHWHRHEVAQVIIVRSGEGIIADRAGDVHRLLPGDVVHIGAGEEHWHGASPDSFVAYFVLSIGSTEMLGERVDDATYRETCATVS